TSATKAAAAKAAAIAVFGISRAQRARSMIPERRARSVILLVEKRPWKARLRVRVAIRMMRKAGSGAHPGSTTRSGWVKTAAIKTMRGMQSTIACIMVRTKGASAIREVTAATTELGGESSPKTATKKAKKWTTQGSRPARIMKGATT